ncbi:electron transporter, partial [Bacillus toyonensis]|nr:electron transporter [Bacillus toyonensis]
MAAGGNAIRGTRVGSGPMGEQDHGYHADRIAVSYWDGLGNETIRYFAAGLPEEEIP